jgi:hypothetical protein
MKTNHSYLVEIILDLHEQVQLLTEKVDEQLKHNEKLPEWYGVTEVALKNDLHPNTIRKKILSGDYEEDVDFKYEGSLIKINAKIIQNLTRKRKKPHTK